MEQGSARIGGAVAARPGALAYRLQAMSFAVISGCHWVGLWTHTTNGGTVRPKAIPGGASG